MRGLVRFGQQKAWKNITPFGPERKIMEIGGETKIEEKLERIYQEGNVRTFRGGSSCPGQRGN